MATALERHLVAYGLATEIPAGGADWEPGDLIFYDNQGNDGNDDPHQLWDHVNIVTRVEAGRPFIGQHDHDYTDRDINEFLRAARRDWDEGVLLKHLRPVHNFANIAEWAELELSAPRS